MYDQRRQNQIAWYNLVDESWNELQSNCFEPVEAVQTILIDYKTS